RFTRTHLYRIARRTFSQPADLDAPLALLVQHHYLRLWPGERSPGTRGRQPAVEYEVNPLCDFSTLGNNSLNSLNSASRGHSVNSVNCSEREEEWVCDPGPDPFQDSRSEG